MDLAIAMRGWNALTEAIPIEAGQWSPMFVHLIPLLNDELDKGNGFVNVCKRVAYADATGEQAKVCDLNGTKCDVLRAFVVRIGVNAKEREMAKGAIMAPVQRYEVGCLGNYENCDGKTKPGVSTSHGSLDSGLRNLVPLFDEQIADSSEDLHWGGVNVALAVLELGTEGDNECGKCQAGANSSGDGDL